MEEVTIELTNVRENGTPETGFNGEYSVTLPNGKSPSGIAPGNKNLWPSIQAHLDAKKHVEKYVTPPVPSADEVELAQLDNVLSREIEDVVSILSPDQQEAFYAKTDNAPEGKRKRVAMERKVELRQNIRDRANA